MIVWFFYIYLALTLFVAGWFVFLRLLEMQEEKAAKAREREANERWQKTLKDLEMSLEDFYRSSEQEAIEQLLRPYRETLPGKKQRPQLRRVK